MSAPEIIYDILTGDIRSDSLWLLAVSGLHNAIKVMNQLAAKHPGAYFVLDDAGGFIVAEANTLDQTLTA